jgi:flagellar protein FlaH
MGGGIPIGSLTLIEGDSHSGKSVLTQQMIWGSLYDGFLLSLFTTENTVKSLVRQMQSLNIDVMGFVLLRRFRVYPMQVARLRERALESLYHAMLEEGDRDMLFLDALTPCIVHTPIDEVLGFFEDCKRLCANGQTVVTVIHSHSVSHDLLVRIQSLCDAHIRLRTEEVGEKLIKTMEIAKVRGATKATGNIASFEVEPGWGMKIIPISRAQG